MGYRYFNKTPTYGERQVTIMILFLNFAPIEFLGGAERKMLDLYEKVKEKEDAYILSVHPRIANIYARIVLRRTFEIRNTFSDNHLIYLDWNSFIPFTTDWRNARDIIKNSRVIYLKSEILEFLILFYLSGFSSLKKSVAGVRSPWLYASPMSFFDHFHNLVYKSPLLISMMKKFHKIHLLNPRDYDLFKKAFKLDNAYLVPNDIKVKENKLLLKKDINILEIIFIGELVIRKGIDTLLNIIEGSPANFKFHIIGNGPMKDVIIKSAAKHPNVTYYGYINHDKINSILPKMDVLLLPSRAEGFAGVILEGMVWGLPVVNSNNTNLKLPEYIEYSSDTDDHIVYIQNLKKIYDLKKENKIPREKIREYAITHYNSNKILSQMVTTFFT